MTQGYLSGRTYYYYGSNPYNYATTPRDGQYWNVTSYVYGTNASNAINYSQAQVTTSDTITTAKWASIRSNIRTEQGRWYSYSYTSFTIGTTIGSGDFNSLRSNIDSMSRSADTILYDNGTGGSGPFQGTGAGNGIDPFSATQPWGITTFPAVSSPALTATTVTGGTSITALNINKLLNDLQAAGNICTCNCNYCTCNCNYCTCNCNYSCTCNCNYSDERVKTEIEYI